MDRSQVAKQIEKLLSNFPNEVSNNDYIANTIHLENLK